MSNVFFQKEKSPKFSSYYRIFVFARYVGYAYLDKGKWYLNYENSIETFKTLRELKNAVKTYIF